MKKKIIATVLGLAAITSLAACTPNVPATSEHPTEVPSETTTTPEPVVFYNVVLPSKVDGAYVSASTKSAKEGDEVVLTVVLTDSDTYQLDSVKLGDTKLEGKADENNANVLTYRFLMPAGDANIAVNTSKIVIPAKDHKISIAGSDKAVVAGLPSEANTGDTVTFKVSVVSGFTLSSVTATAGEAAVELTGDAATGYTFTMPDADVVITAEVIGNLVKLTQNTEKVKITKYDEVDTASFIDKYIDSDGGEQSAKNGTMFFRGGSEVKFIAKHLNAGTATHFYVGEAEVLPTPVAEDADLATALFEYTFTMPYEDVELKATIETTTVGIKFNTPEGITASAYMMMPGATEEDPEVKTPVTSAKVGDKVYVEVKESGNFVRNEIKYSCDVYKTETGLATEKYESSPVAWGNTDTYDTFKYFDADTKYMVIPEKKFAGDITIEVTGLEAIYNDKAFVGSYSGVEWYGHKVYGGTRGLTINGAGLISSTVSKFKGTIKSFTEKEILIAHSFGERTFYYENGAGAICDGQNPGSFTDIHLFVKGATGEATYVAYTGAEFDVVEVKFGETSTFFLVDFTNNKVACGVTVTLEAGTNIADPAAKFIVKNGTTELAKVGYPAEGGEGQPETGDALPFANAIYKASYVCPDYWGSDSSAVFTLTFDAQGKTVGFNGEDPDAVRVTKTVACTYDAETRTLTFKVGANPTKAVFTEDFAKLVFDKNTSLRNATEWNFHTEVGVTANRS